MFWIELYDYNVAIEISEQTDTHTYPNLVLKDNKNLAQKSELSPKYKTTSTTVYHKI